MIVRMNRLSFKTSSRLFIISVICMINNRRTIALNNRAVYNLGSKHAMYRHPLGLNPHAEKSIVRRKATVAFHMTLDNEEANKPRQIPNPIGGSVRSTRMNGFPLYSDVSSSEAEDGYDDSSSLNKSSWSSDVYQESQSESSLFSAEALGAIASCSLLITGNTVGAGMMILPQVAAGPGMATSVGLFVGVFIINLISGFVISEVAILQREESIKTADGSATPGSFKDLADQLTFFGGKSGGTIVSAVSIMINWCVLAFALMKVGEVVPSASFLSEFTLMVDEPIALAGAFAVLLTTVVSTQSIETLSKIASGAVTLLFLSFGSLLLPGLMHMQQDPMTTLLAQGTAEEWLPAVTSAAPIFLSTLVYQNIIPTVTKLLDFDRIKTRSAITVGSGIPLLMYISWCFAVLGGGVSVGGSTISILMMEAFSAAAIGGSSIACVMSLAEEFESLTHHRNDIKDEGNIDEMVTSNDSGSKNEVISLPSVLLGVLPPLAAGILLSHGKEFTVALETAGSYGSPLLYGVLPALLAWQWCQKNDDNPIPGGVLGIGAIGMSSILMITQRFGHDIGGLADGVHGMIAAAEHAIFAIMS